MERQSNGKEIRYPVRLTTAEREITERLVKTFNQVVCGFDILRSDDQSYVCDVNGFSLVKKNEKYYNLCAASLRKIIINHFNQNAP